MILVNKTEKILYERQSGLADETYVCNMKPYLQQ